jgi:hypothetical protein
MQDARLAQARMGTKKNKKDAVGAKVPPQSRRESRRRPPLFRTALTLQAV